MPSAPTETLLAGSADVAGPFVGAPVAMSNVDPWQGQVMPSLDTPLTVHPWCGQMAENALKSPAVGWVITTLRASKTLPPPTGMSAWAMAPPAAEAAPDAALATASPAPEPHAVRPAVPATATPATSRLSRRDQHEHAVAEASGAVVPGADLSVGCSVLIVVLAVIGGRGPGWSERLSPPFLCWTYVTFGQWPTVRTDRARPGSPQVTSQHHSAVNAGLSPEPVVTVC